MPRALGLLSGGLDSMLAVCLLREQGVEVTALAFTTPFFDAARSERAAAQLGVPLRVMDITTAHLEVVLHPRYGWGSGLNPCIDCHALMLRIAGQMMEAEGFDFIFTGEVLGQRPMSQNRGSLTLVAKLSGYPDRLLRPLSARLLEETRPEREGQVDRSRLLALSGRGRKPQMELAKHYGLTDYPTPAGGCLLTDPIFSRRLKDLLAERGDLPPRLIELLKVGRQLRLGPHARVIVGRRQPENERLHALLRPEEGDWLLTAEGWPAPHALVPGGAAEPPGEKALRLAAQIAFSYSDAPEGVVGWVLASGPGGARLRLEVRSRPRSEFQGIMV